MYLFSFQFEVGMREVGPGEDGDPTTIHHVLRNVIRAKRGNAQTGKEIITKFPRSSTIVERKIN